MRLARLSSGRLISWLGLIVGLLLLIYLMRWVDWYGAWGTLAAAGMSAVATLAVCHLAVLALDVHAWRLLVPPGKVSFAELFLMRWVAESVNNIAPVAQVGGEVVRASMLRQRLGALGPAALSVSADFVATAAALAPIALVGVILFAPPYGLTLSACLAAALGLAWFIARSARRLRRWLLVRVAPLRARLQGLDRRSFARAWLWHVLAWLAGSVEIYVGLLLLGFPVTFAEALTIECVLQASRALAFMIPAGIGVQEGAIVALTAWAGVPHAVGLGLALLKRAREISLGLTGLLTWGVWAWRQRSVRPVTS